VVESGSLVEAPLMLCHHSEIVIVTRSVVKIPRVLDFLMNCPCSFPVRSSYSLLASTLRRYIQKSKASCPFTFASARWMPICLSARCRRDLNSGLRPIRSYTSPKALLRQAGISPDLAEVPQVKEAIAAAWESLESLATVGMGRRVPHLTQEVTCIFSKKIVNS
jgi:hypothetical protein